MFLTFSRHRRVANPRSEMCPNFSSSVGWAQLLCLNAVLEANDEHIHEEQKKKKIYIYIDEHFPKILNDEERVATIPGG